MKTIIHSLPVAAGVAILLTSLPALFAQEAAPPLSPHAKSAELKRLVAIIRPVGDGNVRGSVLFEKIDDGIRITAKVGGLTPNAHHAIHIHEFGDLGSDDATSAGEHFNPGGHQHGLPDKDQRHAGDMGNLQADGSGNVTHTLTVSNITLDAGPNGILGRAVIVHAKADDGGQPSGNAGGRIGAGVIGVSKDAKDDKPAAEVRSPSAKPADAPSSDKVPAASDRDSEPADGKRAESK